MMSHVRRWLQLRFERDCIANRLPLDCNSTALRLLDDLRYDRGGLLHCDLNIKYCQLNQNNQETEHIQTQTNVNTKSGPNKQQKSHWKILCWERWQTEPGLVALYDIRQGNWAGLFLQPRRPHGANDIMWSVVISFKSQPKTTARSFGEQKFVGSGENPSGQYKFGEFNSILCFFEQSWCITGWCYLFMLMDVFRLQMNRS